MFNTSKKYLIEHKYRYIAYIFLLVAILLSIICFVFHVEIIKPELAGLLSFSETKLYLVTATHKIILLLFILGFTLRVFSKERREKAFYAALRFKALIKTLLIVILWIVFNLVFVSGNALSLTILLSLVLPFLIYLFIFNFLKKKETKRRKYQKLQQLIK